MSEHSRDAFAFPIGNRGERRKRRAPLWLGRHRRERLAGQHHRLPVGELVQRDARRQKDSRVKVMAERLEREIRRPHLEDLVLTEEVPRVPHEVIAHIESREDEQSCLSNRAIGFAKRGLESKVNNEPSPVIWCVVIHA